MKTSNASFIQCGSTLVCSLVSTPLYPHTVSGLYILRKIQIGTLLLRRWTYRIILLTIGLNIWIDYIIGYVLTNAESWVQLSHELLADSWAAKFTSLLGYDVMADIILMEDIIRILLMASLIGSMGLWFQIIWGFLFLYADYRVTLRDEFHKQWFWLIIVLANLTIFYALKSFF